MVRGLLRHLTCGYLAVAGIGFCATAESLDGVEILETRDSVVARDVVLGVDRSTVINLPRDVADVVITNSGIADAIVQSTQRIIFRGIAPGETNAILYDRHGDELVNLQITVERDFNGLQQALARHVPESRVSVDSVNGSVVLSGAVDSQAESEQIVELVRLYTADEPVVNMMSVAATDQVLLEVRIVEMSRTFLKRLGINPSANIGFGDLANEVEKQLFLGDPPVDQDTTTLAPGLPFSNSSSLTSPVSGNTDSFGGTIGYTNYVGSDFQSSASVAIEALERVGISRTLAEPNITAVSGETGTFLAGGEFPVPLPATANGQVAIEFKQFGVGLGFTPVVLSEDRISLRLSTEVSELSTAAAVDGVPGLTVRRVETTVELPSGQSMMIAGLIQSSTRQELDQFPGLKEVPVLGSLFQSRDFNNEETELVVIITPYLVDPTSKERLRTPADGFANAGDLQTLVFGRLNRMYAEGDAQIDASNYRAPVGFIEE